MECSDKKKKALLYLTEKLMLEAQIEIRDTWQGYDNEIIAIKMVEGNGPCLFDAEKEAIDGFNSLSYKNATISLPKQYSGAANEVIHEAVHFLQHNDWTMDSAYFKVRSFTIPGFKEFVSQREETEAHFIQMLFMSRYEPHLIKERELKQFKNRLGRALKHPAMRVDMICWAVRNDIFVH
ncbi:hypothetical protein [Mucilaginibacter defluvii]|uniref:IrrE N-terminal-like domain-containing protein n=1 Tax=Mucilaginibacter defluvii TaxID=1196019 RepID=A0ABP9FNW2_9SPHI|nr:hypothetical protein [Bacteroidota bacterium]